jgi:hypothetical protein
MGIFFKALALGIVGMVILLIMAELFIPPLKPVSNSKIAEEQKK